MSQLKKSPLGTGSGAQQENFGLEESSGTRRSGERKAQCSPRIENPTDVVATLPAIPTQANTPVRVELPDQSQEPQLEIFARLCP